MDQSRHWQTAATAGRVFTVDPCGQACETASSTPEDRIRFMTMRAQRLKGLLQKHWNRRWGKLPFIRAITVLHGRDSRVELDQIAMTDT